MHDNDMQNQLENSPKVVLRDANIRIREAADDVRKDVIYGITLLNFKGIQTWKIDLFLN